MKIYKFFCWFSMSVIIFLLNSCHGSDKIPDQKEIIKTTKPQTELKDPLPKLVAYKKVNYHAQYLRSPFAYRNNATLVAGTIKHFRNKLQAFSLNELKIVGTIILPQRKWALMTASNAVVVPVTVGDHIGKTESRVVNITDKQIEVMETIGTTRETALRIIKLNSG